MKIISWNIRILGEENLVDVLIQETRTGSFDICFIKSLWSSNGICWITVEFFGRSSGMLIMWDDTKINAMEFIKGGYTLSVKFSFLSGKEIEF